MINTTEINTYEQQSIDFLTATNCSFKATYSKTGKYFDSDKEERDIYQIELKRGSRSYKFRFGQSINNSGFYAKMGTRIIPIDRIWLDKPISAIKQHVKISKTWDFGTVKNDSIHIPTAPNAYDVLASMTKYEPGTFENFCSEFGYNEDSRNAEKTYKAVVNEYQMLCTLFTDTELELLQEIN